MLNFIRHDSDTGADGVPLVIAHGLFGSARNWGVIARRLAKDCPVIAVDMRNHGDSAWQDSQSYDDLAADLTEIIASLPGDGPVDLLGHSMGGKAAMVLALTHPARLRRLIVADIAPVAYSHSQTHNIDAMRQVDLATVTSRGEAAEAMGMDDAGIAAFLLQSLDMKAKRWKLNLDVLERDMPLIIGFPPVSGSFGGEVLVLSGAASDYVKPDDHGPIRNLFPKAQFAKIPGAGHWLHAEKPREFEAAVAAFLRG